MNRLTRRTSPTSTAPMMRRYLLVLHATGARAQPEMQIVVVAAVAVVDADRAAAGARAAVVKL